MVEKKVRSQPIVVRRGWIAPQEEISVVRQCELASVNRSTVYARSQVLEVDDEELTLCRLMDEEYTRHPFYGSRRMVVFLREQGYPVNRKRVQRLMQQMGLAGMATGPNTSQGHPEHKVYPYLLRGVARSAPQSGLEYRYNVYSPGTGLRLSGGNYRLVQSQGVELALE